MYNKRKDQLLFGGCVVILVLLVVTLYSNTLLSPFVLDDFVNIIENSRIKNVSNFLDFSGTRYTGYLTLSINYYFNGFDVYGYHVFNIMVHALNSLLVFSLVTLTLKTPLMIEKQEIDLSLKKIFPFAVASVFAVHPIQTQAITYVSQRFATLVALFYLLAIVFYIQARLSVLSNSSSVHVGFNRSIIFYCASLLSAVLAMKSKENSFTLPVTLMVYEFVFFKTRYQNISKRKKIVPTFFIPLLLTCFIIPLSKMKGKPNIFEGVRQYSRTDYLYTQFDVVVTYFRLMIFPVHQNFDYDYPVYHSFFDRPVLLSFLFLTAVFSQSLIGLLRCRGRQLIAFGLIFFFITVSVESSIVPLQNIIFEHRLYLPSVGFILSVSAFAVYFFEVLKKRILFLHSMDSRFPLMALLLVIVFLFSYQTYQRNKVWSDPITLWEDVVSKSPSKPRPNYNLARAYQKKGFYDKAREHYKKTIEKRPFDPDTYYNLGLLYYELERWDEAILHYLVAVEQKPDFVKAYNNLSNSYDKNGRTQDAITSLKKGLSVDSKHPTLHYNLASLYLGIGLEEKAIYHYQQALKQNPAFFAAHINLGGIFFNQGLIENAIRQYQLALKFKPNQKLAHYSLGDAYKKIGLTTKAEKHYGIAKSLELKGL